VICGRGVSNYCTEGYKKTVTVDSEHEVRCCKDGNEADNGFSFKNDCNVLAASKINNVCHQNKNFEDATQICESVGARLCSQKEVENQCTKGTGCQHDSDLVWACSQDGLTCETGSNCCSGMCDSSTSRCISENNDARKHWLVCGKGTGCIQGDDMFADANTEHEVRCCKDGNDAATNGFEIMNGCSVGGLSEFDGICYHDKNFTDAMGLCSDVGGRLCSRNEIENKCTRGTGCMHDMDLVWTCSDDGHLCESHSDCCSNLCDTTTETCVREGEEHEKHWVICGSVDGCSEGKERLVGVSTKHEVRCCKDGNEAGNGFSFRNDCDVLAGSKFGGVCYHDMNFADAMQLCSNVGGRLCSRNEIENRCTKGTGCQHDKDLVWACSGSNVDCGTDSDCCSGSCDAITSKCASLS